MARLDAAGGGAPVLLPHRIGAGFDPSCEFGEIGESPPLGPEKDTHGRHPLGKVSFSEPFANQLTELTDLTGGYGAGPGSSSRTAGAPPQLQRMILGEPTERTASDIEAIIRREHERWLIRGDPEDGSNPAG